MLNPADENESVWEYAVRYVMLQVLLEGTYGGTVCPDWEILEKTPYLVTKKVPEAHLGLVQGCK